MQTIVAMFATFVAFVSGVIAIMEAEKVFGVIIPDDQTYFKETVTVKECCEELEKIINKQ